MTRYIIARLLEAKREMKFSGGRHMGYVSEITFGKKELKEMEGYVKMDSE